MVLRQRSGFLAVVKRCYPALYFVLFLLLSCSSDNVAALDVINISNTPGRSEHPTIASSPSGSLYVAWDDNFVNNESLVVYIVTRPTEGEWSQPLKLFEPRVAQFPDIVVDDNNTVHLAWREYYPQGWYSLLCSEKDAQGNWMTPDTVSVDGIPTCPSVAVDAEGNIHIVWVDAITFSQYYARKVVGGSWSVPIEISSGNAYMRDPPQIALDSQGSAHVVWVEWQYGVNPSNAVTYTTNATGMWSSPETIVVDYLCEINSPSIAGDPDGTIHLIWAQNGMLYYASRSLNAGWSTPVSLFAESETAMFPSLAIDTDGALHIVWSEHEHTFGYSMKPNGNGWLEPTFYTTEGLGWTRACIAVTTNTIDIAFSGFAHVDSAGTENYEIFFAEIEKE